MLNEKLTNNIPERTVENCIEREEEAYYIKNISQGVVHSVIVPIILGYFFGASIAWGYLFSAFVLYATVFRNTPSAKTFFIITLPFLFFAAIVVSVVYHA